MYTQDGHKIIYKIRGGSHLYGVNTPLSYKGLMDDLGKIYEVADKCTLPDSVDSTKINNLLMDIYKEALMLDK